MTRSINNSRTPAPARITGKAITPRRELVLFAALLLALCGQTEALTEASSESNSPGAGCDARLEAMWDCDLHRLRVDNETQVFGKLLYLYPDLPAGADEVEAWIARLCSVKSIRQEIAILISRPNAPRHPVSCYLGSNLLEERRDQGLEALASAHAEACADFYRNGFFRTAIDRLNSASLAVWKEEICKARFERQGDFYHDRFGRRAEDFLAEYVDLRKKRKKDEEDFLRIAFLHSRVFLERHQRMGLKVFGSSPEIASARIRETFNVEMSLAELREMTPQSYFVLWLRTADKALVPGDTMKVQAVRHKADGVRIQVMHFPGQGQNLTADEQTWVVVKENGEWRIKGLPAR